MTSKTPVRLGDAPARILILGTGLIGTSIGLALRALDGFEGRVLGWDPEPAELATALQMGAIEEAVGSREAVLEPGLADIYVLACPVLPILHWMEKLAPVLREGQLVTDVGSTKVAISALASRFFNLPGRPRFLPGHPMAGKESGGAALADARLFEGAAWLFTPLSEAAVPEQQWRARVAAMGARIKDMDPGSHDELCAWVSHLPQMLSTALAALLEETFAGDPAGRSDLQAIGGRALRETTRLGSSPYSMWRDVAMTNTGPIEATLQALEQRLAHLRENLRTPELRREFELANQFRAGHERS